MLDCGTCPFHSPVLHTEEEKICLKLSNLNKLRRFPPQPVWKMKCADSVWAQLCVMSPMTSKCSQKKQSKKILHTPLSVHVQICWHVLDYSIMKSHWEPPFGHSFDSVIVPAQTALLHRPFSHVLIRPRFNEGISASVSRISAVCLCPAGRSVERDRLHVIVIIGPWAIISPPWDGPPDLELTKNTGESARRWPAATWNIQTHTNRHKIIHSCPSDSLETIKP